MGGGGSCGQGLGFTGDFLHFVVPYGPTLRVLTNLDPSLRGRCLESKDPKP